MKSKLKFLLLITLFLLFIPTVKPVKVFAADTDIVNIPDENLRKGILKSLKKDSNYKITVNDMKNITKLHTSNENIVNLSGLEYCTNLEFLYMEQNEIYDLSPLANLINLRVLELDSSDIFDISPLANLINLKSLDLHSSDILDFSPLASLTNLEHLYLRAPLIGKESEISDISSLAKLTKLERLCLELDYHIIPDISSLTHLNNLKYLSIIANTISDISPLAKLTNLTHLKLNSINISDISSLANLTNLTSLNLYYSSISDISPLANLTNLTNLNLNSNNISDISPLFKLTNLKNLDLYNQNINLPQEFHNGSFTLTNIIPNMTNISYGGIYDTNSNSITWNSLDGDKTVSYNFSQKVKIGEVTSTFSGKVSKSLIYDSIINIENEVLKNAVYTALNKDSSEEIHRSELEKITYLDCSNSNLNSLNDIEKLPNLEILKLSNNKISDLTPLTALTKLTELYVDNNIIKDISPLKNMASLKKVDASKQKLSLKTSYYSFSHITCKASMPVIGLQGVPVINIFNITNGGTYSKESNTIKWKDLYESTTLSYDFEETSTLLNGGQCTFTGTINKKVIIKN